jgi:hypothetical protein
MLRQSFIGLTTFVENNYIPYFNYYSSWVIITLRPIILAILVIFTLSQIGITLHLCLNRSQESKGKSRWLCLLISAGMFLLATIIFWGLAVLWHTQIIALIMAGAYLGLIIYQRKYAQDRPACCQPGKHCCLCPSRTGVLIIMLIGYAFVLFSGWLFLLD